MEQMLEKLNKIQRMELKSQQCLIELHDLAHEEYRRFEEERNMLLQCLHAVAQLKQEREEELQQLRDRLSETNEDIRLLEREKERLEKENSKAKEAKERYQYLGIRVQKIYRVTPIVKKSS
jgi:DNA repair exonuclease SbcCD ATPase subunit